MVLANKHDAFVVPVYLNQRLVFDLVAMLQGGIATVSRTETSESESMKTKSAISSKFGLADAFGSLLNIKLSAEKAHDQADEAKTTVSEERTHTPASLFVRLRSELLSRGLVVDAIEQMPEPGQFVEFRASMSRSPLIQGLENVTGLLAMVDIFAETKSEPGKGGAKSKPESNQLALNNLAKKLQHLRESLKVGNTEDLVATVVSANKKVVIPVDRHFLNDETMSDLIDGTFQVLGKVTRVVNEANDSISLLRKVSVGTAPAVVTGLLQAFANLNQSAGLTLPPMEVEIRGPAFQVLPIAIFS